MNKTALTPAYLLHRREYRNSSLILDLFSEQYGRVKVVAKGVKRSRLPLFRYCQPFLPLLVSWVGRSDLKTLVDVETQPCEADSPAGRLQGNALISGLYLNELLVRLLPDGDPHSDLYYSYEATLDALLLPKVIEERSMLEVVLRRFELALLRDLGFGLDLTYDRYGQPIESTVYYAYIPGNGFESVEKDIQGRGESGLLQTPGRVLIAIDQGDFSAAETLRETKRLMRSVLQQQLGGEPLKTRALVQT